MLSDAFPGFELWHVPLLVMTAIMVAELLAVSLYGPERRTARSIARRSLLAFGLTVVCVVLLRGS